MPPAPIIGLLTDYGTRDSYVAQMKGVILSRCDAKVVDLTHEIEPMDVFGAGIFLREVAPRFEPVIRHPIVLVTVVDPGVGSSRRILAAESGGRMFLAPDNGILSIAIEGPARFVEVIRDDLALPRGSRTFDGRDRFAPVAAAIARGTKLDALGPVVDRCSIVDHGYRLPDASTGAVAGQVVRIDRFGNIVSDLDTDKIGAYSSVELRGRQISDRAETYAEREGSKEPFAIVGSMGTLEISISGGDAARELGVRVGDRVIVIR